MKKYNKQNKRHKINGQDTVAGGMTGYTSLDYKKAYYEMKEVMNDGCVEKAILFAVKNPALVYGKGTEEFKKVVHGFFDLYCSVSFSKADCVGAYIV